MPRASAYCNVLPSSFFRRREESQAKAQQLASQGRHAEARELYVKCVDVSPRHAYQLIKVYIKPFNGIG